MFTTNDKLLLKTYTDVDYVWSILDRRYTTDYYTFLRGNQTKKQTIIARSNAKLEFQTMSQEVCKIL